MKALKFLGNFFGILIASVLSIALVLVLVVSPAVTSAMSFFKPSTVEEIIKSEEFRDSVFSEELLEDSLESDNVSKEALSEILESDAFDELYSLVAEEISTMLNGKAELTAISKKSIVNVIENNIGEISRIAYKHVDDPDVTLDEIKSEILNSVDENAEKLVEEVKEMKVELVHDLDNDILEPLQLFNPTNVSVLVWGAILLLAALILLVRFPRFKGFMWNGVCFFIGFIGTFLTHLYAGKAVELVVTDYSGELDAVKGLLSSVTDVAKSGFKTHMIVYIIIAILSTAVFIICRVSRSKKAAAAAAVITQSEAVEFGNSSNVASEMPVDTYAKTEDTDANCKPEDAAQSTEAASNPAYEEANEADNADTASAPAVDTTVNTEAEAPEATAEKAETTEEPPTEEAEITEEPTTAVSEESEADINKDTI